MVITEYYDTRSDGIALKRTYSDKHLRIMQEQTGNIYDEAIDVDGAPYTYVETEIPLPSEDTQLTEESGTDEIEIRLE